MWPGLDLPGEDSDDIDLLESEAPTGQDALKPCPSLQPGYGEAEVHSKIDGPFAQVTSKSSPCATANAAQGLVGPAWQASQTGPESVEPLGSLSALSLRPRTREGPSAGATPLQRRTSIRAPHLGQDVGMPGKKSQSSASSVRHVRHEDEKAVEKARALECRNSLLRQANGLIAELLGSVELLDDTPLVRGYGAARLPDSFSQLRGSVEELAQLGEPFDRPLHEGGTGRPGNVGEVAVGQDEVPAPLELTLLHEQMAATAASVADEFPTGTIPEELRARLGLDGAPSGQSGTVRARAVRIRGGANSVYPFCDLGVSAAKLSSRPSLLESAPPLLHPS
ncbi:unnamed protein product [Polarella glacialis]|uniref:Uncharacterized protein n=1 Tax=Polarella glacialis TaxID=89957 RepID=A0A813HXM9_POLGL|nr:unnamed protein product [Polarella glacialis]